MTKTAQNHINDIYTGLTAAQVTQSRAEHGANVFTPPVREPLWHRFVAKFSDPLIIILLIAGVLSVAISFYEYYALAEGFHVFFEPIGIFIAILLATGLAFAFELQADREFAVLNQVNDDEPVTVIRRTDDGPNTMRVARRDVVVGDIVVLNAGDEVPADGTLLTAVNLSIDESTLTGEPVCRKTVDPDDFDPEATFASNRALRGTRVMEGHGTMRVTAVGDATEAGHVYEAAQIDDSVRTPLNEQLDRLGALVSRLSYAVGAVVIAGRIFMYFTSPAIEFEWVHFMAYLLQTVMIAVTLIVVAVPEGLPMAVTLALAYSMRRMLHTNNLVRRLHACETMGAATVICTDKTGTLTQNQMQVHEADVSPQDVALGIAVNSTAELDLSDPSHPRVVGNPTEGALLLWLWANGIDYRKLRAEVTVETELPFNTENKYMATVVRDRAGDRTIYVKGAPEIVMTLSADMPPGATRRIEDQHLAHYQAQAMRTLALAHARLDDQAQPIANGRLDTASLTLDGLVAIADPVRPEVPGAVDEVQRAGINIKIVTGDTPGTAREIGRQIGLWHDDDSDRAIITGTEFGQLTDQQLQQRVGDLKIIARARPMDKKRLVEALQRNGEVVAVTGDGTNDAPALKAAHVGLSMGDGTAVAKEASDITIIDNSFSSIGRAVMWGRSLYQNLRRFILFQLTVNVAACLIVLAGAFIDMQSPLTVTQMLWVNLIMDTFAAMALASLPPSTAVMRDRPRPRRAFIINSAMWRSIIGTGLAFFAILLALLWYFEHVDLTSLTQIWRLPWIADGNGLSAYELTLFFTIFVFLQFWNMFNARAFASWQSAFRLSHCSEFELIALLIVGGQILIVELAGGFFNVTPLRFTDWLIVIGVTSPVLWIGELARLLRK